MFFCRARDGIPTRARCSMVVQARSIIDTAPFDASAWSVDTLECQVTFVSAISHSSQSHGMQPLDFLLWTSETHRIRDRRYNDACSIPKYLLEACQERVL